jgi:DNA-binding NarL/FixJ family response regulator
MHEEYKVVVVGGDELAEACTNLDRAGYKVRHVFPESTGPFRTPKYRLFAQFSPKLMYTRRQETIDENGGRNAEIIRLAQAGKSQRQIAKELGISQPTVGRVIRKQTPLTPPQNVIK